MKKEIQMKKIVAPLGVLILIAGLMAGCAGGGTPTTTAPQAVPYANTEPVATMEMGTTTSAPSEAATMASTEVTPQQVVSGNSVEVEIEDFAFNPEVLTIKVGTTVTWGNKDSIGHTATSDTGIFNSGILQKGEKFSFTFTSTGTYNYHCTPHPNMVGTIVVID
jgi:plastocyanin